jgi:hypothetical protein
VAALARPDALDALARAARGYSGRGNSAMNHKCHGDYYELHGARWYRCLLDSTILDVESDMKDDGICPRCERVIDATDHGKVDTRELAITEFMVDGQWHTHSICISPIKRAAKETCAHQHPDRKPDDTYCRDCGEHF